MAVVGLGRILSLSPLNVVHVIQIIELINVFVVMIILIVFANAICCRFSTTVSSPSSPTVIDPNFNVRECFIYY